MISTQYINLNMVPSGVMPVLHCSQYDVGRPLGVVIYNGSESVDLSGYTVTIEGTRTDRTPVTAGVTTDGNIGVFTTTPTMTNENDTYRAKVVLTDNAGRVSSLAFVMCVDEKTMDENAEEIEEDASLYQQYTGTVQTIIAQIRGDLAAEITARQNAVSAEATARQNAISAEASARQAADNTLQSNINAEASARATEDASLQSQINQLIAPSGSAPSAAEVENARIGSDGTVYPTLGDAIRTQNSLLKSHLDDTADAIGYYPFPTKADVYNANHYINYLGAVVSSDSFSIYGLVELDPGMTITVTAKGYSVNVAIIATTDEFGQTFVPVVISTDDTVKTYTYTANAHTWVALSSNKNTVPSYSISTNQSIIDRLNNIESGTRYPSITVVAGEYVNYQGEIISSGTFARSVPIAVSKGETVDLYARGWTDTVAMITTCDANTTHIVPVVISPDAVTRSYKYSVDADGYIIVSYDTRVEHSLSIYSADSIESMTTRLNEVETRLTEAEEAINDLDYVNVLTAFDNLTCIGDSLTWSQVFTSANTSRQAYVPYPKALARKTGADYQILARPGASAYDAWNEFKNQIIARTNDLTIIYLGTNNGLTNTVDTDCVGNDYESYANTHTGRYGSIIQKSLSLGNKVVLIKVHSTSGNLATTNETIEALGSRFNVPVIGNEYLSGVGYHNYPDGSGSNGTHYNDLGYSAFADQVIKNISNLSSADLAKIIPV